MKKLLIFIDHDIVIRHFFMNDVLAELRNSVDVVLVLPRSHRRVNNLDCIPSGWEVELVDIDEKRCHYLRRLFQIGMMARARSWDSKNKKNATAIWKNSQGWKAFLITQIMSLPLIRQLNQFLTITFLGENREIARLVEKHAPDALVHPTVLEGLFASDLILTGKKRGIPTLFLMNSWDNPSSKASALGCPDILGVWGEQTKRHAMYYTGVPESHIRIIGAAQFDVYKKSPVVSREDYRKSIGVGTEDKILLYAGSSKGVNETAQLKLIEESIVHGNLQMCKVVYRPHPWRAYPKDEKDFFDCDWTHVVMDPESVKSYQMGRGGSKINIELADYRHTHTILSAIDCIISPLSTILLEANLHGVIGTTILVEKDVSENAFLRTMAGWIHFHEYFEKVEGFICRQEVEMVDCCQKMLETCRDQSLSDRLKKQSEYFVIQEDVSYSDRVKRLLLEKVAG